MTVTDDYMREADSKRMAVDIARAINQRRKSAIRFVGRRVVGNVFGTAAILPFLATDEKGRGRKNAANQRRILAAEPLRRPFSPTRSAGKAEG